MDITDLLTQGLNLMLLGMGMVFLILGLLIYTLKGVSALILKYSPPTTVTPAQKAGTQGAGTAEDEDLLAAITSAIHRFRSKK